MKKMLVVASTLLVALSANAAQYPTLSERTPEAAGFDTTKLKAMDTWINQQIDAGYPSFNLLIVKDDAIVYRKAYGWSKTYDQHNLMATPLKATTETMYDFASNSKMYATNFALQKLIYENKLSVDDLVSKHIPGFGDQAGDAIKGKDALKIKDLLHHTGGFPADPQYPNKAVAKELYSQDKATTLEMIKRTPLEYKPGTKHIYSDVDYMLLGFIVEAVTKLPLDRYVEETIYRPLGLTHTVFNPLKKGFKQEQIAATELNGNTRDGVINFPNIRTKTLWGEVHDEKAYYAMGGVSGHAGLFTNTGDAAVLVQLMLNGGGYGDVKLFDANTIKQFTSSSKEDPTFGLGWRVNGHSSMTPTFGTQASPQTYGHTGWTGTLTSIDPANKMAIVILGNRPHSPVVDPKLNPNVFVSGMLPISTYGWVVDQVYGALK